jgi:hypothetical protein
MQCEKHGRGEERHNWPLVKPLEVVNYTKIKFILNLDCRLSTLRGKNFSKENFPAIMIFYIMLAKKKLKCFLEI